MIKIYGRETPPCSRCKQAANICEMKGAEYEVINVGTKPGEIPEVKFFQMFPNASFLPVIVVDDTEVPLTKLLETINSKQSLGGLTL